MSEQEAYEYLMTYDLYVDEVEEWVQAMATVVTDHGDPARYWGQHRANES